MGDETQVVGLFKTRQEAEDAVRALEAAGYSSEQIGLVGPGDENDEPYTRNLTAALAGGGTAGAVTGGVLGLLVAGAIPGLGFVVAAGSMIPVLVGIMTGGSTGMLAGGLLSMAGSDSRALYYQQQVQSGSYLVSVTSDDPERAREILEAHAAFEAAAV